VWLQNVSPGFDASNILTLELTMSGGKYNNADTAIQTYRDLWSRLENLPAVTAAGGVSALPLSQMFAWGPITIEGRPLPAGEKFINADQRMVGGNYFQALGIPLIRGRLFNDQDTRTGMRVVIVDEYMAQQFWPNEDPVGKRVRTGGIDSTGTWLTIVGVVGRVKQYTLDSDSRIAMYFPHAQFPARAMNIVVRSNLEPLSLTPQVRNEIRELDPDLPVYNVRSMAERVSESLARRRFSMLLLTLFAASALILAAIGIYGVMAYLVTQGTRELGIRIALGATPQEILMLVVRQGMIVTLWGMTIGLAGAFVLTRFMQSLLFGITTWDPITFAGISVLLTLVALLASYIPARRASRIDPMVSVRVE
jgi:predicted permease